MDPQIEALYQVADQHFENGNYQDTINCCNNIIALNPLEFDAYAKIARIYSFYLEDGDQALATINSAFIIAENNHTPPPPPLYYYKIYILKKINNQIGVIETSEKFINDFNIEPNFTSHPTIQDDRFKTIIGEMYHLKYKAHKELKQFDDALHALNKAEEYDNTKYPFLKMNIYWSLEQYDNLFRAGEETIAMYSNDSNDNNFDSFSAYHFKLLTYQLMLMTYFKLNKFENALTTAEELRLLDEEYEIDLARAICYRDMGMYDECINAANRMLESISPENKASAYIVKAKIHIIKSESIAAIADLENLFELITSNDELANLKIHAYCLKALALAYQNDFEAAHAAIGHAIAIEESNMQVQNHLFEIWIRAKDYTKARDVAKRMIEIDGNNTNAIRNKIEALVKLNEPGEALTIAENAITSHPNIADFYRAKSYILNNLARFEESLEFANLALAKNFYDDSAHFNKAWALCGLGRFDEGLASIKEALKHCPIDAKNLSIEAWSLYGLGRHTESIQSADKALLDDAANIIAQEFKAKAELALAATEFEATSANNEAIIGEADSEQSLELHDNLSLQAASIETPVSLPDLALALALIGNL